MNTGRSRIQSGNNMNFNYDVYYKEFYLVENNFDLSQYEKQKNSMKITYSRFKPSSKSSKILELGCGVGFF